MWQDGQLIAACARSLATLGERAGLPHRRTAARASTQSRRACLRAVGCRATSLDTHRCFDPGVPLRDPQPITPVRIIKVRCLLDCGHDLGHVRLTPGPERWVSVGGCSRSQLADIRHTCASLGKTFEFAVCPPGRASHEEFASAARLACILGAQLRGAAMQNVLDVIGVHMSIISGVLIAGGHAQACHVGSQRRRALVQPHYVSTHADLQLCQRHVVHYAHF